MDQNNSSNNEPTQPTLVIGAFRVVLVVVLIWVIGNGAIFILKMAFSSMGITKERKSVRSPKYWRCYADLTHHMGCVQPFSTRWTLFGKTGIKSIL